MAEDCLFCKIIQGDIPSDKLYEDDEVLAFRDIAPAAPVHFLVIPKKHISGPSAVAEEDEQLMGKLIRIGNQIAEKKALSSIALSLITGQRPGRRFFTSTCMSWADAA